MDLVIYRYRHLRCKIRKITQFRSFHLRRSNLIGEPITGQTPPSHKFWDILGRQFQLGICASYRSRRYICRNSCRDKSSGGHRLLEWQQRTFSGCQQHLVRSSGFITEPIVLVVLYICELFDLRCKEKGRRERRNCMASC